MTAGEKLFRTRAVDAQNVMNGRVRIAPPVSWTATTLLVAGIIIIALIFASFATYARTVEVTGTLQTTEASIRLTAPERGSVSLAVEQGDDIKRGQLIATTALETLAGTNELVDQRRQLLQREIDDARMRAASAQDAGAARSSAAAARSQSARLRIDALSSQLSAARSQTRLAREDLQRAQEIAQRGFLSKRDMETREAEVSRRIQEESRIEEEIARARGEALEADAMMAEARSSASFSASDAMEAAARAQRDLTMDSSLSETHHIAQIDGSVATLPVRNGQILEKGELIAIIMPNGSEMVAVLQVPASKMTDIKEGMEIGISVDAYPYETFGMIRSKISTVSQAATDDDSGPTYTIEAAMPKTFNAYGEAVSLLPGMTLSARIKTRERTLIEWLLEPLYAVGRR